MADKKSTKPGKAEKPGIIEKTGKPEKAKKTEKTEETEKAGKTGKKEKFDRADLYHDVEDQRHSKMNNKKYFKELRKLEIELIKLQEWVKANKLKMVVIFEGRDAAGKGGVIKTISGCLNPRICRVVALGTPTEKEKTQWYFQRYVPFLPAGGEIVLFDRSWYHRAGVGQVVGV